MQDDAKKVQDSRPRFEHYLHANQLDEIILNHEVSSDSIKELDVQLQTAREELKVLSIALHLQELTCLPLSNDKFTTSRSHKGQRSPQFHLAHLENVNAHARSSAHARAPTPTSTPTWQNVQLLPLTRGIIWTVPHRPPPPPPLSLHEKEGQSENLREAVRALFGCKGIIWTVWIVQEKEAESEKLKEAVRALQDVVQWSESAQQARIWIPWAKVTDASIHKSKRPDSVQHMSLRPSGPELLIYPHTAPKFYVCSEAPLLWMIAFQHRKT